MLNPQQSQAELVGALLVTQDFAHSLGITVLTNLISVIHCIIKLYNCVICKPVSPTRPSPHCKDDGLLIYLANLSWLAPSLAPQRLSDV